MIIKIEFIDTETFTMYKKKSCAVKDIDIFYGILKLEVTFNIISILLLYIWMNTLNV